MTGRDHAMGGLSRRWQAPVPVRLAAAALLACIIASFAAALCEQIPLPNHCCPQGYEFDLTYQCCLPENEAVRLVAMHGRRSLVPTDASMGVGDDCCVQVGYCEEKMKETGNKCGHAEGSCRNETRDGQPVDECEPGLECAYSYYSTDRNDSACCKKDEEIWTGKECMKYNSTPPWMASWTRTGKVALHSLGGQMIPNGLEAQGWDNPGGGGPDDRFPGIYDDGTCDSTHCHNCMASSLYWVPPSPIWGEARNLGNVYQWPQDILACNGPFIGIDATIKPYKGCTDDSVDDFNPNADFQYCPDCTERNCNCGRQMTGIGDRADGIINDGGFCNVENPTSCIRKQYPPYPGDNNTQHECNCELVGHGGFTGDGYSCSDPSMEPKDPYYFAIFDSTPLDPRNATSTTGVNASELVPELCGRIQRKEVASGVNGYYPHWIGDSPVSWFDFIVYEFDQDYNLLRETPYPNQQRNRDNDIMSAPPNPHTLLKENTLNFNIGDDTRHIKVEMNYTVENQIIRTMYLKQCTWRGCSRLEELVVNYTGMTCYEQCDGTWDCVPIPEQTSGPPPQCCTEEMYRPDENDPTQGGDSWGCPPGDAGCGDNACRQTVWTDCDGNTDNGAETPLRVREFNDCGCQYACWGCWHFEGQTDWYPLTYYSTITGQEEILHEQINDTSVVKARPFGEYLRVENPLTMDNSETKTAVNGRMLYGDPNAYDYAMGYITVKMVDDESQKKAAMTPEPDKYPKIDMFSGMTFAIPDVANVDVRTKQYPTLHTLHELESTLPLDYILLPNNLRYLNRLNDMCYFWKNNGPGIAPSDLDHEEAEPMYIRWLINPPKKFYSYSDLFQGSFTQYNFWAPIEEVNILDLVCRNYFDERSDSIPLNRNFNENEPLYYDYETLQIKEENIEGNIASYSFNPSVLANAEGTELSKAIDGVYARAAPACDEEPLVEQDVNDCSHCPDMCSAVAKPFCSGGKCDCEYLDAYKDLYPKDKEECVNATDWRWSNLVPCEGPPSKYKSYCSRGNYYAYWLDTFQYKYRGDGTNCDIQYMKLCDPKKIPAKSYTLIFEHPTSIHEWNVSTLNVFSHFKNYTFTALGADSPCDSQTYSTGGGGLTVNMEKPRPKMYSLDSSGSATGGSTISVDVVETDLCDNSTTTDCESVYVNFEKPYADYTGWYPAGGSITMTLMPGNSIKASLQCIKDHGFYQSRKYAGLVSIKYYADTCDFLLDNLWILIIGYLLVMSFQFFERIDPYDFWRKFMGKD